MEVSVLFGDAFQHVRVLVVLFDSEVRDHFVRGHARLGLPVARVPLGRLLVHGGHLLLEHLLEELALVDALDGEQELLALVPPFAVVVGPVLLDLALLFGVGPGYARDVPPAGVQALVLAVPLQLETFDHRLVELAQDQLLGGAGALVQKHLRPLRGRRLLRSEGGLPRFVVLDLEEHAPLSGRVVRLLGPIPLHELLRQGLGLAIAEVPEEMLARDGALVDHGSCPGVMQVAALVREGLLELSLLVQKSVEFLLPLDVFPPERDLPQVAPQIVLSRLGRHFEHRVPPETGRLQALRINGPLSFDRDVPSEVRTSLI